VQEAKSAVNFSIHLRIGGRWIKVASVMVDEAKGLFSGNNGGGNCERCREIVYLRPGMLIKGSLLVTSQFTTAFNLLENSQAS
jgi:hypothetical protein